ncbi:phage tail assembly protein [Marinomonas transparens]|uniref:Phage tail assembly protein n=1 Tax=Marinomonas transparens TaxID=2795388 RepID=A0A934JQE3_9GAMM|nr:phage tail assembly protein [Marinomonas transparens]MBJ7540031.1 phage tail assembly protein [Marinomonas transparens]
MFKPRTHDLVWSIKDDKGQPIDAVSVDVITMGQHRALSQGKNQEADEVKLLRACISKSTGLPESTLKSLVTPDYNSVQDQVLELMTITADKLIEGDFDLNSPTLLIPIQGDDGQEKSTYKLRPPTVATTDLMDSHDDEWQRTIFISSSCSGFSQSELESLSLPDWNQLQERLIDFLGKSADFFRQEMSKS